MTVAGMIAVITAVLGRPSRRAARGRSLWPLAGSGAAAGAVVAAAALTELMRYQNSAWIRGSTASLIPGAEAAPN